MSTPGQDPDPHTPPSPPSQLAKLVRLQVVAVCVVGVLAGILFVASLLTDGDTSAFLGRMAAIIGIVCAILGASFVLTAGREP